MGLTQKQYADILDGYAARRRQNRLLEQERREEIYAAIPAIRTIDEDIAHISLEAARSMLFHPDPDIRKQLHEEISRRSGEKTVLLVSHGFPEDYLDPLYTCRDCKDTGLIDGIQCHCFSGYVAEVYYEQSNLTDQLDRISFATFRLDYYSEAVSRDYPVSPRDNILKVLDQSRSFIREFDDRPGQNLLIYGRAGTGKTFLSCCIAGELLARGKQVIYMTAYQFFRQLELATFHSDEADPDTLSWLTDCDLLIIDDLGTEMNNAFINSQLFLYINERILRKKSTIINTNLSLQQISSSYTERVSSRIIEAYRLIHIYGEDIRIKKAVSSDRFDI